MEEVLFILVVLVGLAVVGPILARLVVAYRKGLAEIEEKEAIARRNREEATNATAKATALEADIARLTQEQDGLYLEMRPLEESLSPQNLARRPRIYMPTDRWSQWDEEYVVVVANAQFDPTSFHPEIVESWRRGRQHVFWAQTELLARQASEARFPAALGYEIKSIEISRNRLLNELERPVTG